MSESEHIVLRSPSNPTVRHLIRLRENRYRRKADRVIVDGWRETAQAIESGMILCGLYVSETAKVLGPDEAANRVLNLPSVASVRRIVSDEILEKISYGQSSRGVVAEFERPDWGLERLRFSPQPLVLVLDKIEKPGNIGAVFRCADAAGVDAVLLSDCPDRFNPNAIRNSLGAIFRVPSAAADSAAIANFLTRNDFRVLAARVESSTDLWEASWEGRVAVVLGNEAEGLGDRWKSIDDRDGRTRTISGIRIPMAGKIDSLNISVSAAVIAFEAGRRRGMTVPLG